MHTKFRLEPNFRFLKNNLPVLALLACMLLALVGLAPQRAQAQSASGTISGTVTAQNGAVITDATVTLENVASGVKSSTVSNGTGFFKFAAVAPSTYKLTISAQGFSTWVGTDIIEHLGESHDIPHIILPVAGESTDVQVTASEAGVVPIDNGSSTMRLNETLVDTLSIQGRNASELVKFMPGMAMNTGLGQVEFNSQVTKTNSGPIGAFSANGTQPNGSMQMTLDGASLVDLGVQGTQIANVNQDTTAEFTYLNAAFGADTPRGPNIIQIARKAGGKALHGDVYTYLRNWQLNANDPYQKAASPGSSRIMNHQTYPGATIGGPLSIPKFGFNRNHDKLFFFVGYENMFQDPPATLHQTVTPTTDMLNGDFSTATLPGAQTTGSNWWPSAQAPCVSAASWTAFCTPNGYPTGFPNGQIPKKYWDSDGLALLTYLNKVNPPNVDPATHNGFNSQFYDHPPVNRWELHLRGDYNPTGSDKISVLYTRQNEADINNFGIWYEPGGTAPLPTQMVATTVSDVWTGNYVHVFNPTTTNEFSSNYTYFSFVPKFANAAAMTASTAGYNTYAPFDTLNIMSIDQLPNIVSWRSVIGINSGSFPQIYAPPMMKNFGNAYGGHEAIYSLQDNLTKVVGRHSLKTGIFWDSNGTNSSSGWGNFPQGEIVFDPWAYNTTGNPIADMLIGAYGAAAQASSAPTHNMAYHEWAIYGQDQWLATRKITVTYGVRLEHDGQWYPTTGPGLAVFDPSSYDNTASAGAWSGMKWHEIDKSIPRSGFVSKLFNPDVRAGFAYDLKGDGKTVVRGGFGVYRWQFSENDVDGSLAPGLNVKSILASPNAGEIGFSTLATYAPTAGGAWCALASTCPTDVWALTKGEDSTPYTMNWDVMVDRELPTHLVLEAQYIGNHTANALLTGQQGVENNIRNINKIPLNGLFGTDAQTGINYYQQSCNSSVCTIPPAAQYNGYRPYANYGTLNVPTHGSYSNYNGLVAALQKQTGRITFIANYTFSKVLGIRDGDVDNGAGDGTTVDPFSVRANYGPLAYDRTHIFNIAYYIKLPGLSGGSHVVRRIINDWQLSGGTQLQSGAPIQPNTNGNMTATWETNTNGGGASNAYLLGTTAPLLTPYITCDPRHGGGKYFNASCFQTPNILGKNGPAIWPYIKTPAYFGSDLAVAKSFTVREAQRIDLRISAFNFLNHPLPQLGESSDVALHMDCTQSTTGANVADLCDLGGGNLNTTTNGNAQFKAANQNRVMELALKYYF
jgi:hypothetical protein